MAVIVVVALTSVALATGNAVAHEAGTTNEHGDVTASGDAVACAVDVHASDVDFGHAFFELYALDGELITVMERTGHPQPDPGPARFAIDVEIDVTTSEAARVDHVVMRSPDGEHSATVHVTPFTCAADEATPPACPPVTDVRSEDADDPEVRFMIHVVDDADAYRVYRAAEGGDFDILLQVVPGSGRGNPDVVERISFSDEDVDPGVTYTYRVTAINDAGESMDCEEHEVTAIPFFGAPVMIALGTVGALGAFTALRRRT